MRTLLIGALLAALALPLCAVEAMAHGGQYRGPGGAIPPEQREPFDPQPPPPPPPPTGAPPVTGSPQPTPGRTGDPSPVSPGGQPVSPGATPLTGGRRPTGARATITADSWIFWYENNKAALEDLKHGIYAFTGSNPLGFGSAGDTGVNVRSGARHLTRSLVKSDVVPALLWAMDPANVKHQDIESAAYIALAKTTDDPVHAELLRKGLKSKNLITRESAMLSLGLLRRERAADQFDATALDKARAFLFDVFADTDQPARTRAFAAFGIGLLGDQPTGRKGYDGAAATTERLFEQLRVKHAHPDLAVSLLMAISLQPAASLNDGQRKVLRGVVTKGRLYDRDVQDFTASYAALALGRIGDPRHDALTLLRVLGTSRGAGVNVERSAVISLGKLAARALPEDRVMIAKALKDGVVRKRIGDRTARNLALISLAYLVQADVETDRTDVLGQARVGPYLLEQAEDGRYGVREYAALALGLICKTIGDTPSSDLYGEYQSDARRVLRGGLDSTKIDPRGRGAYAVALGIAGDELSIGRLVDLVADTRTDDDLRGYAAIGLGHVGVASRRVLDPIRKALTSRRSEKLRRATATALGMLHDRQAVTLLLEELKRARSMSAKGQVVIALAKVGDERALTPLIELLRDKDEKFLTRALACAGLGIVGDAVWIPSLSRIGRDINYRASGDAINEVLSIL